jgi:hypothetical protein
MGWPLLIDIDQAPFSRVGATHLAMSAAGLILKGGRHGVLERRRSMIKWIMAALMATTSLAHAKMLQWNSSGYWNNYAGTVEDGTPSCAMGIKGTDRSLMVKYFGADKAYSVQVFKNTWRIPEGTEVTVEFGFDSDSFGTTTGIGLTRERLGAVQFDIDDDSIGDFMSEFRSGKKMWLKFPDGNETDWFAMLNGSKKAADAFGYCVSRMKAHEPTQPFTPTQPFEKKKTAKAKKNEI